MIPPVQTPCFFIQTALPSSEMSPASGLTCVIPGFRFPPQIFPQSETMWYLFPLKKKKGLKAKHKNNSKILDQLMSCHLCDSGTLGPRSQPRGPLRHLSWDFRVRIFEWQGGRNPQPIVQSLFIRAISKGRRYMPERCRGQTPECFLVEEMHCGDCGRC